MGHSNNQARKRLTLPLPLRAKMTGLAIFICGFMGLITSAQLDPISAHVERVIDGDTIQVRFEGKSYTVPRSGLAGEVAELRAEVARLRAERQDRGGEDVAEMSRRLIH